MKFLILNYYYQDYLDGFYSRHRVDGDISYEEARQSFIAEAADISDAYSSNLRKLDHEAEEVIINNEVLQKKWALENSVHEHLTLVHRTEFPAKYKRFVRRLVKSMGVPGHKILALVRGPARKMADPWMGDILTAQVKKLRPDILFTFNIGELDKVFFRKVRPFVKLIVGQHASPLPHNVPYKSYDLIVSSLPHYVEYFRQQGVASEYLPLAFNESILSRLQDLPTKSPVVHVGSYGPVHTERNEFLEAVASQVRIDFWGVGTERLSKNSPILQNYHGEAWGMDRNNILHNSQITLTKHISAVAGRYANNLTLYEATGAGTLLITDYKENLNDLFTVGKEVVAYHNVEECIDLVRYYLAHESECKAIAFEGQKRTLRDHTTNHRMEQLLAIINQYLVKGK